MIYYIDIIHHNNVFKILRLNSVCKKQ